MNPGGPLAALVLVTAVLYLARELLIPLAVAILLAFLLAPAVRGLERLRLGRLLSTLIAVVLGFSVFGAVAWEAGSQLVTLTAKLPEYRANVGKKIRDLTRAKSSDLGKAAKAIKELEQQADPAAPKATPVVAAPASALAQLTELVTPFTKPLATALAVLIFTILMLLERESMRERLIALIGARRINVTTQALGEASNRVSQYLFMQLVVNACFGIPFGIALYLIGVPNAALWGLLATLLRFIPYAGVWIAVAMPALIAFAIADGWSMLAWTLGVALALELVLVNALEPWLYGRSAGLSPIAIIAAAIFWTWLWGPLGLLLATPLTVCVAVIGRHIPQLGYLNVLLGVEPVLPDEARFYQRLVAMDLEEAQALAERHAAEHGVAALYDRVLVPALSLAEHDRHAGSLDKEHAAFVFDTVARIIEDLEEPPPPNAALDITVGIAAAHDEADQLAATMLGQALCAERKVVLLPPALAAETLEQIAAQQFQAVCIVAVPPQATAPAAYLCKRLKKRYHDLRVVVLLWTVDSVDAVKPRLETAGADAIVTRLAEAVEKLRG